MKRRIDDRERQAEQLKRLIEAPQVDDGTVGKAAKKAQE